MKCYAVSTGEYSDYRVLAIYSTREKAQAAIDLSDQPDTYEIEEFDLDPPDNAYRADMRRYTVTLWISRVPGILDKTSTYKTPLRLGGWGGEEDEVDDGHFYPWHEFGMRSTRLLGYRFICTVVADSEERAIKVANERRIMALANTEPMTEFERKYGIVR